jgi:hypothetical protein
MCMAMAAASTGETKTHALCRIRSFFRRIPSTIPKIAHISGAQLEKLTSAATWPLFRIWGPATTT